MTSCKRCVLCLAECKKLRMCVVDTETAFDDVAERRALGVRAMV